MSVFFLAAFSNPVWAADNGKNERELSIDAAVDLALGYSKDLQKNRLTIESDEEMLKLAQDNLLYTPIGPTEAASRAAYSAYLSADMNLVMNKKSKSTIEDQTAYSVFSRYVGVLTALDSYYYAEANLKNEQKKLSIARVSYSVGIISKYELEQAEIRFITTQQSKETALVDLNTAYISFNTLLGLNMNERPLLTDKPAYSVLVTDDVEKQIIRVIDNNPQIWRAEKLIEIAEIQRDLLPFNSGTDTFYNRALEVNKAQVSSAQAKEAVKQAVRTTYNNIIKMEEQYASAQEEIKAAENTLKLTKVRYEVGFATESEVIAAEVALINAQNRLSSLVYSHELGKIAYEKPWAISSGSQ